ncbi:MAG: ABC transporter substrate-binding protein [Chloroflexota bacterium]|jgi:iron complex transport system substrate-binding protein|nr:ABC transporter substrate-binding protein [Chloroflexota bacterium]
MRIVSLSPAATEIVCAIGLEHELVAVTHACDWPPYVVGKPVVTTGPAPGPATAIPTFSGGTQRHVMDLVHGGQSLRSIDIEAVAASEPDLILAHESCRICAVEDEQVRALGRKIGDDATVLSLEPTSIEGILNAISTIGAMTEAEEAAMDVVASLRARLGAVETRVQERRQAGHRPPRVVGLQWLKPPFAAGHWVPEQIRRAGGWDLLGEDGGMARPTSWESIAEVSPEMLFLMPAGSRLADVQAAWGRMTVPTWVQEIPAAVLGAIFALDAHAYFDRPGPRVIDGVELLAEVMDPDGFIDIAPQDGWAPVGSS